MTTLTTVIPTYNSERYLGATLESLARQTRRPDRVVVLDDCSTDGTSRLVASFTGLPLEWRAQPRNLGIFGNLNAALEFAAETDYLHILHADDLLKPEFYATALAVSAEAPAPTLLYCGTELFEAEAVPASRLDTGLPSGARRVAAADFLAAIAELRPFYFCAAIIKSGRQPLPCRFPLDLPHVGDMPFWAALGRASRQILALEGRFLLNRLHPFSGTSRNMRNLQAWVLDEYRVMRSVEDLRERTGLPRWVRAQKLACVFAARSMVKAKMMAGPAPEYAREILAASRREVGGHHWLLARLAVWLSGK